MVSKPPYRSCNGYPLLIRLTDLKISHYVKAYDIVKAAEDGDIKLLFRVPRDKKLILVPDPCLLDYERPPIGRPPPEISPDYLELLPHAGWGLLREGFIETKYSVTGYKDIHATNAHIRNSTYVSTKQQKGLGKKQAQALLNIERHEKHWIQDIYELPAGKAGQNPLFPVELQETTRGGTQQRDWMYWGIDSGNPLEPAGWHTIHPDDILIIAENFFNMKGWRKDKEPTGIYWDEGYSPSVEQKTSSNKGQVDYRSPQLLRMCEAASKFWGGVRPEDQCNTQTHPKSEDIVNWLLEREDLFSRSSAENANSLIKPIFATKAGRPEK